MSTFSGISGALSALHSQRRGLDVAGQNVANANTEGYTRQRVQMQAVAGSSAPALWSTSKDVGNGVAVADVQRMRDGFLEGRARTEHAQGAYLNNQKALHASIENVFAEPSDTALQAQMADFWSAWGDAGLHPEDLAARAALIQRGTVVADGLRSAYDAMSSQWISERSFLQAQVVDVNTTAATVAMLNSSILTAQTSGLPINEMADQRDIHLMNLAKLTGATASVRKNGTVDVYLGGSSLVSGMNSRKVEAFGANRLQDQPLGAQLPGSVGVRWTDTGSAVTAGGSVGATMETLTQVMPYYGGALDDVAATLASTVNTQHALGYGLDGGTGRAYFTGSTAAGMHVNLTADQLGLSLSAGTLDGSNADKLAGFGRLPGGADRTYQEMIANLGVAAQSVERRSDIQNSMTADLDSARASASGVNLDEEMTNMLSYQRAYEAASRVLTTIDGMLDQLINRTGLVGR
jgi:flagellar hook-associated protein 1 FlgK